jgi:hypothetical protein
MLTYPVNDASSGSNYEGYPSGVPPRSAGGPHMLSWNHWNGADATSA